MAEMIELKAWPRERVGKGAARAIRRDGRLPGVIYGDKTPPEPITLDAKQIRQRIQAGQFLSTLCIVDMDGKKTRVIPRELQLDPVRDTPLHVDLLRLAKGAEITVDVTVNFVNDELSAGLKRGGVLNIVRHTLELVCPVESIPEQIEADLEGLEIGDSLHISAISLPDGVRPVIADRDFTVATIVGAAAAKEEVTGGGEQIEGGEEAEEPTEEGET